MVATPRINDLRDHLVGRLKSGAWWTFVAASPSITAGCLLEIEKRFYSGSSADDFELALVPWRLGVPMTVIACGHKRRLPVRELSPTLTQFMKPETLEPVRSALAAGGDVLVFGDESPTSDQALMMAFMEFLEPGAALRVAMRN
jgi:hypothetical protein